MAKTSHVESGTTSTRHDENFTLAAALALKGGAEKRMQAVEEQQMKLILASWPDDEGLEFNRRVRLYE